MHNQKEQVHQYYSREKTVKTHFVLFKSNNKTILEIDKKKIKKEEAPTKQPTTISKVLSFFQSKLNNIFKYIINLLF